MGQLLDHSTKTLSYRFPQKILDDSLCFESLSRLETACFFSLPMFIESVPVAWTLQKDFKVAFSRLGILDTPLCFAKRE